MARPLHLTASNAVKKRGGTYWFILSVPPALRDQVGRDRWRFSLGTSDKNKALLHAESFLSEVRAKVRDSLDISSVYMRELSKIANYSPEDAEHVLDSLYPEVDDADAAKFYAARKVSGGDGLPASSVTLRSIADSYLTDNPERARAINDALSSFGADTRLSAMSRSRVGDWIDMRKKVVSVRTIRVQLSALRTLLKHAARHDIVPMSVLDVLARWDLKSDTKAAHKPMPDEMYRMICADRPEWVYFMRLMRLHALRPSEVYGLELTTHEGHPVLTTTHSKTRAGRQRLIPVHPAVDDIEKLLSCRDEKDASRLAQWLTKIKWHHSDYAPYRDKLINLYGCRVAAITDMAKAGISEEIRMRLVGHSSSVHRGYISTYSYDQLLAGVSAIRDPI